MSYVMVYLSSIAAILTILATLIATSRLLRRLWEKYFLAKPRDRVVTRPFNYYDVQAGMAALVEYARTYNPDALVGINRGGAIVGGILGKHLGRLVHIVEVRRDQEEVEFDRADEYLRSKRVLLIDDRLSTGSNMRKAYKFVHEHAADIRCMVFAWSQSPTVGQAPDAFGYKVAAREIPLPWEPGAIREWY